MIGAMLGTTAVNALEKPGPCKLFCVGWIGNATAISSGPEMQIYMDIENRTIYDPWWVKYKDLTTKMTLEERDSI
jgi:hypothetical protein